jgi:hypothetical protein
MYGGNDEGFLPSVPWAQASLELELKIREIKMLQARQIG